MCCQPVCSKCVYYMWRSAFSLTAISLTVSMVYSGAWGVRGVATGLVGVVTDRVGVVTGCTTAVMLWESCSTCLTSCEKRA